MKKFLSLIILLLTMAACSVDRSSMDETREKNIKTVKKFFALLEQEKIKEYIDLYAENGKQINPYHSGLFPEEVSGKSKLFDFWKNVPGNFDGMKFPISEIYPSVEPHTIIVKVEGSIKLKENKGVYNNNYLCIFKFNRDGKILEYHEYFNPIRAARCFGMLDKIK